MINSKLGVLDKSGARLFQFPLEVSGPYRKARNVVYTILIFIFLALPWLRINGEQAMLLDIPGRKFHIMGLKFWAHDAPMVFFVFAGFALGLIFVTSIWGRIWCGWACPQTVFIDGVYRLIERFVEGPAPKRKLLAQAPWGAEQLAKFLGKHSLYLLATLVVTHSFLAYFVGTKNLRHMVTAPPSENWVSFLFILGSTAILYFNFTWFREQFCIIMCPYGRLQSALFDTQTMVVGYDYNRPDCIDCKKCVFACPTGIDIRQGVQLECIACTACMDACDTIMEKVKKPKGLIRYTSEAELNGKPRKSMRPRTFAYGALLLFLCMGLVFALSRRQPLGAELIRTEVLPKARPTDPSIFRYSIEFTNHTFAPKKLRLGLEEGHEFEMVVAQNPVTLRAGQVKKVDFFIKTSGAESTIPVTSLAVSVDGEPNLSLVVPLSRMR